MPYVRNTAYRDMPFAETSKEEFYTYSTVTALIEKGKLNHEGVTKCQTIGLIHCVGSRYYLSDLKSPSFKDDGTVLRISMRYMGPTQLQLKPYPVQVFGTLQWIKRPVLFVNVLQELTIPMAIRLSETMNSVVFKHMPQEYPG